MGLFKDLRSLIGQAKVLEKQTKDSRPGIGDMIGMASQAMSDATAQVDGVAHLQEVGVRAFATVVDARPTDMRMNERPVIDIDLRLGAPHDGTEVTVRQPVHSLYLARLVPDAEVAVVTDPADADTTQVVWE